MTRILLSTLLLFNAVTMGYADEFDTILASFGNLSTVAGTALVDRGSTNGWNTAMEGETATA